MLPEIGTGDFIAFLDAVNKGHVYEGYRQAVDHSEDMSVHVWGTQPIKILNRTRPREDDEIRQYRLDSYEPITKGKSDKAVSILYQIFKSSLYSISWKETPSGQELKEYLTEDFPIFGDFILYIREVVFKNMLADPNGAIILLPSDFTIEESERILPVPIIVASDQILNFVPGEFYIIRDRATIFDEETRKEGAILHVITAEEIVTYFESFDEEGNSIYTAQERGVMHSWTFVHGLGEIPVWMLGGNINGQFQGVVYDSFFSPALPHWNKAVNSESDLDGAFYNHMHPIRVELVEDCDYELDGQVCQQGKLFSPVLERSYSCPSCRGTGKKTLAGPYGRYLVSKDKLETENATAFDPVSYVTVPVEPTKLLKERRDKQLREGLEAINMDIVNETGENQSGVAKEIDRTELRSFMLQVSDFTYDNHAFNFIWFTNLYMFGTEQGAASLENIPEIAKPVQFDTLTERELTEQISTAKKSGLSPAYIVGLQMDINKKQFNNSPEALERANLTTLLNPLPEKDADTIMAMVAEGSTSPQHAGVALNVDFLVSTAMEEESFLEMSMIDKFNRLVDIATENNLIPTLSNVT